jgi:hypothetical protein
MKILRGPKKMCPVDEHGAKLTDFRKKNKKI